MIKWITIFFSILISGQIFPKSIASCSFSEMNLVPHYYFQGQKGPIYWGFFQGQKVQFRSLLHILSIYLFKICLLINILLIGMELLQDSAKAKKNNTHGSRRRAHHFFLPHQQIFLFFLNYIFLNFIFGILRILCE